MTPSHHQPAGAPSDDRVAAVLASAFAEVPTIRWAVPEPAEREAVTAAKFTLVVDHARANGGILTAGAPGPATGAVVWLDHTADPVVPLPDYRERLRAATGAHHDRFAELDALLADHRPSDPHCYIALVGVLAAARGQGIASALLDRLHSRLDRDGVPAYLEAASEDAARLYRRHGYRDHGEPFHLRGGGPALYPMWRTPEMRHGTTRSGTGHRYR
jgi:ribosomal protein S18 acetylase RimI-like enzyme